MQELPTLHITAYVISFLGQVCVFIGCIILLIKRPSLATVFMGIGMLLSIAFSVLGLFMNYFSAMKSPEAIVNTQGLFSLLNTSSYLIFGIGLILLGIGLRKNLKKKHA